MVGVAEIAEWQKDIDSLSVLAMNDVNTFWSQVSKLDPVDREMVLADIMPQIVGDYSATAAQLSADFYSDAGPAAFRAIPGPIPPVQQVQASTGWALSAGEQVALPRLASMTRRLVFTSSRETIAYNVNREEGATWARYASSTACPWCRMLATRGAVYSGASQAKAGHDNCKCMAVPVRPGESYDPPGYVKDWEQQYIEARKNADSNSTKDILKAWPKDKNALGKTQLTGSFAPKVEDLGKTQLTGSFAPKLPDLGKTQLTGSFAPKVDDLGKTQLTGSFAPKPPDLGKTQLTGSFAPKVGGVGKKTQLKGSFAPKTAGVGEKTQLKGSFAPKTPPVKLNKAPAVKPAPVKLAKPDVKAPPVKLGKPGAAKPTTKAPLKLGSPAERRRFRTKSEGKEWAYDVWGRARFDRPQIAAIRNYTGDGYRSMNAGLRASKGAKVSDRVKTLDSAFDAAPRVPEDIVVGRKTTLQQFGINGTRKFDPSSLVGKEYTEHGFLSTSVNERGTDISGSSNVTMKLAVPKGKKALYVSGDAKGKNYLSSVGGGEAELILERGTKFKVTGVKRSGNKYVVEAEVIE